MIVMNTFLPLCVRTHMHTSPTYSTYTSRPTYVPMLGHRRSIYSIEGHLLPWNLAPAIAVSTYVCTCMHIVQRVTGEVSLLDIRTHNNPCWISVNVMPVYCASTELGFLKQL